MHDKTNVSTSIEFSLSISGKPLLRRLVDEFKNQGINQITVVAGYKAEAIDVAGIKMCLNREYENTGELVSLTCAMDSFHDDMLIMYGDLLFRSYILNDLLDHDGDIVVVVDSLFKTTHISGMPDYAYCSQSDDRSLFNQVILLNHVSETEIPGKGKPSGRWIGMLKVRSRGRRLIEEALLKLKQQENFNRLTMPDLLNYLVENGNKIHVLYINGHWLDVNVLGDIDRASEFTLGN